MPIERNDATSRTGPDDLGLGLHWRIKDSFVRYVLAGSDGAYAVTDGAEDDGNGNFFFPVRSVERDAEDGWRLRFGGDVRFSAHGGMLRVAFVDPVVTIGATIGTLEVSSAGGSTVTIARVERAEPQRREGLLFWPPLSAGLTKDGVGLLGGVYPVGELLDPLRIVLADG